MRCARRRMEPASRCRSARSITWSRTRRWRVSRTPRFSSAACSLPGLASALIRSPEETRRAAVAPMFPSLVAGPGRRQRDQALGGDRQGLLRLGGTPGFLVGDVPLDFLHQLGNDLVLGYATYGLAVTVDHAVAPAAGHADVGGLGLAGPVHGASHHRQVQRLLNVCGVLLDLANDLEQVHFEPPAGGAGDNHRSAGPNLERLQDVVADAHLLD